MGRLESAEGEGGKMTDKEKLIEVKKAIKEIIAYPKEGHPRRTKDGYPFEIIYDEWAYNRLVRSFRDSLKQVLRKFI
jgi:hypothetical protein